MQRFSKFKYELTSQLYNGYIRYAARNSLNQISAKNNSNSQTVHSVDNNYLGGMIVKDTVINKKSGTPVIREKLMVKPGVAVTIAPNTELVVQNDVKFEKGSKFILNPGSKLILQPKPGNTPPKIILNGTLQAAGTKEEPVIIHGYSDKCEIIVGAFKAGGNYYKEGAAAFEPINLDFVKASNLSLSLCSLQPIRISNSVFGKNMCLFVQFNSEIVVDYESMRLHVSRTVFDRDSRVRISNTTGSFDRCRFYSYRGGEGLRFTFEAYRGVYGKKK